MWNFTYFVILGVRTLSNLFKIFVVRYYYRYANSYSLISFVLVDGFFLGWLVYGNIIFYSEENNCNEIEET